MYRTILYCNTVTKNEDHVQVNIFLYFPLFFVDCVTDYIGAYGEKESVVNMLQRNTEPANEGELDHYIQSNNIEVDALDYLIQV